jgi:hypothetical protein
MAMAAYIIGMQRIASLASPKKRVVEQGFLEFFQDDGPAGSNRITSCLPTIHQGTTKSRCLEWNRDVSAVIG